MYNNWQAHYNLNLHATWTIPCYIHINTLVCLDATFKYLKHWQVLCCHPVEHFLTSDDCRIWLGVVGSVFHCTCIHTYCNVNTQGTPVYRCRMHSCSLTACVQIPCCFHHTTCSKDPFTCPGVSCIYLCITETGDHLYVTTTFFFKLLEKYLMETGTKNKTKTIKKTKTHWHWIESSCKTDNSLGSLSSAWIRMINYFTSGKMKPCTSASSGLSVLPKRNAK